METGLSLTAELTAREREGINAMHPTVRADLQIRCLDQMIHALSGLDGRAPVSPLTQQLARLSMAQGDSELLSAMDDVPLSTLQVMRDNLIARRNDSGHTHDQQDQLMILNSEIHDRLSSSCSNAGKPWNGYDDRRLRRLFNAGETIAHIAGALGRTQAGIQARSHRFGLEFQDNGLPLLKELA